MHKSLICAVLAAALALSGCAAPLGTATEDLLRAPQGGQRQSAVQSALKSYLGETLQLKYPRGGEESSPMLFADFDGDGDEEAAVLYTSSSKGQNVHLAVLEPLSDGTWDVTYEMEGLSTEVAGVQTAQLLQSGTQLLVGYANANLSDRYLVVYDYRDATLTRLYGQAYLSYLTEELFGDDAVQLAVVQVATDTGALALQMLAGDKDTLTSVQNISLDERFTACEGLRATVSGETRGLVVDGLFSAGGRASEVLKITSGRLTACPEDDGEAVRGTLRYQTSLAATDFGTRGTVEVPTDVTGVATLSSSRRFYYVTWCDRLLEAAAAQEDDAPPGTDEADAASQQTTPENVALPPPQDAAPDAAAQQAQHEQAVRDAQEAAKAAGLRFGVYDARYGYFIELPAAWRGEINLLDGTQAESWQVRMKDGNRMVLSVRVQSRTQAVGTYTRVATAGGSNILLYYPESCGEAEQRIIRAGVTVLDD